MSETLRKGRRLVVYPNAAMGGFLCSDARVGYTMQPIGRFVGDMNTEVTPGTE